MNRTRRPSAQTRAVVELLLADPERWSHGYDLSKEAGIASGTLYPMLLRLADRGYLESKWEEAPIPGRPPRHLYRLTDSGRRYAAEAVRSSAPRIAAKPVSEGQ